MNKYITTAIPYLNGPPHIGHAMDYLLADVWARYQAQQGNMVRLSAGTDEHGTKVEQKAAAAGTQPQQFVDDLAPQFRDMIAKLNVGVTDFVRTTDPDHIRRVQEIWQKLDAADVIYKSTYQGWYCSGCENFLTESEAKAMNYVCPDHQKPLEKLSEENYYLRVSDFTDQIREFAKKNIIPTWRGKEILELIKDSAQDISISRPVEKLRWGIPVPGDDSQVMYVWVDALSNYLTALGYPDDISTCHSELVSESTESGAGKMLKQVQHDKNKDDFHQWWPANVQVIGKDILRFHAIIWPAMLLALGLKLPEKLLVHGHILVDSTKMSKSLGNVIDPVHLVNEYGVDAVRYFFLRHVPTFDDGDFTEAKFIAAYNGELANDLGNLVSRTANMLKRFCSGSTRVTDDFSYDLSSFTAHMGEFRYDLALDDIFGLIQDLNRYVDEKKPWELAKKATTPGHSGLDPESNQLSEVLAHLTTGLRQIVELLEPFLPETAAKITDIFGGETVKDAPILFPKIDK